MNKDKIIIIIVIKENELHAELAELQKWKLSFRKIGRCDSMSWSHFRQCVSGVTLYGYKSAYCKKQS